MKVKEDVDKPELAMVSGTTKTVNSNQKIYSLLVKLILLIFFLFTIWGIRAPEHYFRFNITSILIGSIFLAAIYLCISIGLNMTYDLIGFANFAHAEYFIIGAYVGVIWSFNIPSEDAQMPHLFIVLIIAFVASGLVAVLGDILVFGPLRQKGASNESLMISSIGWGIILRNLLSLYFGGGSEYYRKPEINGVHIPTISFSPFSFSTKYVEEPFKWKSLLIGGSRGQGFLYIDSNATYSVSYEMMIAVFLTASLVGSLYYFLEKTKTGTALRATSNNIDLAESSGIDTEKMIKLTWFIGGGLAGTAGLIFVLRNPIIPYQGFLFLLPAFAVVVLGGIGSFKGSVVASLIIAFSQTVSKSYLGGLTNLFDDIGYFRGFISGYDIVIPFVILIGMILIKPTGLYGEEE